MDDKAIFAEKLDDNHTRYKSTLPRLTVGCVIEYRYKIISKSWHFIEDWTFQLSEPALWSEYTVTIPTQIQYRIFFQPNMLERRTYIPPEVSISSSFGSFHATVRRIDHTT